MGKPAFQLKREQTAGSSDQRCILGPGRDLCLWRSYLIPSTSVYASPSCPQPPAHETLTALCGLWWYLPWSPTSNSSQLQSFLFTAARLILPKWMALILSGPERGLLCLQKRIPTPKEDIQGSPRGPQAPVGTATLQWHWWLPSAQGHPLHPAPLSFFPGFLLLESFPTSRHVHIPPVLGGQVQTPSLPWSFCFTKDIWFHKRCCCLPSARPQHFTFTSLTTFTSVPYTVGSFERISTPHSAGCKP